MGKEQRSANELESHLRALEGMGARFFVKKMTRRTEVLDILSKFKLSEYGLVTAVVTAPASGKAKASKRGARRAMQNPMPPEETVVALMVAPTGIELD
jgi:hypothetical protein